MFNQESGVYRIRNVVNGKVYVGSTTDLACRKSQHLHHLRNGTHNNQHLQRSYNKYGEDVFVFDVLERCNESVLRDREQHWMDKLESYNKNKGYNIEPTAQGHTMSEETKDKIRESQTGSNNHQSKLSEETVKNIKRDLLNTKQPQTEIADQYNINQRRVSSINNGQVWQHLKVNNENIDHPIRDGRVMTEEMRQKSAKGIKNHKHDRKTRDKIGKKHRGENNYKTDLTEEDVRQLKKELLEGEKTQYELADEYNMTQAAVSSIKRGENWSHVEVEGDDELQDTQNKKLDEEDVKVIKWFLEYSNVTQDTIAEKYGVSQSTIYMINTGKNWSHVSIS